MNRAAVYEQLVIYSGVIHLLFKSGYLFARDKRVVSAVKNKNFSFDILRILRIGSVETSVERNGSFYIRAASCEFERDGAAEAVSHHRYSVRIDIVLFLNFIKSDVNSFSHKVSVVLISAREFARFLSVFRAGIYAVNIDGKTDVTKFRDCFRLFFRELAYAHPVVNDYDCGLFILYGFIVGDITQEKDAAVIISYVFGHNLRSCRDRRNHYKQ